MTEREAFTKLYQSHSRKLLRLESQLIKEPYRRSELSEEITRQKGVIHGVGLALRLLGKNDQYTFDDMLSMEAK